MKTAAEVLAHLGIDESHPGPFTYQELAEVVEDVLEGEANYYRNLMRAVRNSTPTTPDTP